MQPRNLTGRLRPFLEYVPWTGYRQRRVERNLRSKVKKRLREFYQLKAFDPGTKRALHRQVSRHLRQLEVIERWRAGFFTFLFMICQMVGGAVIMISVIYFKWPFPQLLSGVKDEHNYLLFKLVPAVTISGFIILFPAFVIAKLKEQAREFIGPLIFPFWTGAVWIGAAGYAFALTGKQLPDGVPNVLKGEYAGLLTSILVLYISVGFTLFIPLALLRNALKERTRSLYPGCVIVHELLSIISSLEQAGTVEWADMKFKREMALRLGAVAYCLERHMPRHLMTGAVETDRWIEERGSQMAAGVRDLIKWVFTPRADTPGRLAERVAYCFTLAAKGEWDSFERLEVKKASRREAIRERAAAVLTALLSASVPIIVLYLLRSLRIISEPVQTYLTVGAFIWAALSLLSHMDPNYGAKLAAIKDVTQLLPFAKKEKD